ncbi:hypothetical protein CTAYLR_009958 [Chrysophaeum taylorii]|uniref:Hexose transporter 1 n=1 Tax=Chrysophaeum taylorii TaxID=2483200 RepID=A0AAD7U7Q3_9STRA|nr:hypothetical protein CTAYLR_009958 [Chrysophaeum taylorii]
MSAAAGATKFRKESVLRVFIFPALGGLLFGYDIGATSYVLPQLESKRSGVKWHDLIKHSAVLQGIVTSGGVAGALVGALIVFRVADVLGRRRELLIGSWLYAFGAGLELASGGVRGGTSAALGLSLLLLGRVVYGVGCGFVMHGAPAYIAEMSPPSVRGMLVSLKEAMIVVGISVGYGIGYGMSSIPHGWQITYGASIPIALVVFFGVLGLPPSARWLAVRGRRAEPSLRFVYGDNFGEALHELEDVQIDTTKSLADPEYRAALRAGLGVVLLQQFTGQPSVLYYATSIFESAGIGAIATVFVGVFKLAATLIAVFAVDSRGRRFLLLTGISVMLVALLGLAGSFADFHSSGGFDAAKAAIIIFIFVYIAGYQAGFGPIAWLLISECFPLEVRGQAVALAVQTNFASNLVVTFLFPVAESVFKTLVGHLNLCVLFGIFAIVDVYSLYFVYKYVPETKGLSLEQIEVLLRRLDGQRPSHQTAAAERVSDAITTPLVVEK